MHGLWTNVCAVTKSEKTEAGVGGAPSAGVTTILISDTSGAERSSQIHPKNQLYIWGKVLVVEKK